ncbi:MAG: molybdopterin converting factor subunit 1 [Pirellulaceae bacterium]
MKLSVKLFAVARQRVGRDQIDVELPEAATVRELRGAIAEQFPPLADVLAHVRFAVNNDYAAESTALVPGCEVALIPPVSGG